MTCAAGVELSEEQVERPEEAYLEYCDEDCVLYSFSDRDSGQYYLAMYRWEDRTLSVLAQEENAINQPELYKGKIYYATDIVEPVRYKPAQAGEEQTAEEEDTVGVRLNQCHLVSDARKVCPFLKRADVQVKIDVSGGIRDIFHPVSLRME